VEQEARHGWRREGGRKAARVLGGDCLSGDLRRGKGRWARSVVEGVTHIACSTEEEDRKRSCLSGLAEKKWFAHYFGSDSK
jgi:hypothetical protein